MTSLSLEQILPYHCPLLIKCQPRPLHSLLSIKRSWVIRNSPYGTERSCPVVFFTIPLPWSSGEPSPANCFRSTPMSSNASLTAGRVNNPSLVCTTALLVCPSFPFNTSTIRPRSHPFRLFSSTTYTTSPGSNGFAGLNHFVRLANVGRYSRTHRLQN